jgi:NitT/TauT family transport system permease protein
MSATMLREEEECATQTLPIRASFSSSRAQASYRTTSRLLTVLPPLLLGIIILGSWYLSTAKGLIPTYELPVPGDVWSALWTGTTSGLFLDNAWITIQESIGGFLLALVIALPMGYGLAKWRFFAATMQPYLAAGQAIPAIVIAPFLVLWLGYGTTNNLVLCTLVVFFPMVITTALGFSTIEGSLRDAARVEGAGFWPLLSHIEFPLASPAIMAAVRTGLTLSITGALVGEFVTNSSLGLGALVQVAKSQYNLALMFATVIVLGLLAAIFYGITWGLTKLSEALYM